jgi:hypothetical protein
MHKNSGTQFSIAFNNREQPPLHPSTPAISCGKSVVSLAFVRANHLSPEHLLHSSATHAVKVFRKTDLTGKETYSLSASRDRIARCHPWRRRYVWSITLDP